MLPSFTSNDQISSISLTVDVTRVLLISNEPDGLNLTIPRLNGCKKYRGSCYTYEVRHSKKVSKSRFPFDHEPEIGGVDLGVVRTVVQKIRDVIVVEIALASVADAIS